MSWAIHYSIRLAHPLTSTELVALEKLNARHGFSLEPVIRGVGRLPEWKGLIPDAELQRLEKAALEAEASRAGETWDYRDFISLHSQAQLRRIIVWLREVEGLLPTAVFTVKEDYSITRKCRPSEVDLEALGGSGKDRDEESEEEELPDDSSAQPTRGVAESLARARRDFARWKGSKTKK